MESVIDSIDTLEIASDQARAATPWATNRWKWSRNIFTLPVRTSRISSRLHRKYKRSTIGRSLPLIRSNRAQNQSVCTRSSNIVCNDASAARICAYILVRSNSHVVFPTNANATAVSRSLRNRSLHRTMVQCTCCSGSLKLVRRLGDEQVQW